ncbi:MAG TPA: PfkB family carbohydrate kinase [Pirellulales bacterium]|nr:PfkB family carbohydrate kinase [Pirellulales bacterium]
MIVAAGLSPAWQQILVFPRFTTGEVNRAREAHWCGSGKVLNVGIALGQLGADAVMISPVGGPAKPPITAELAALACRQAWIEVGRPTRVCTTILDESTGQTTELVEEAGPLAAAELAEFERRCAEHLSAESVAVFTGSIPGGTPPEIYARLLRQSGARAILDLRGPELAAAMDCQPLVVKPNREELGHIVGRTLADDGELRAAMAALHERGAQWVVISNGRHALWASGGGRTYHVRPPEIVAVNPIGSGDCLAAAMGWQIERGATVLDALRVGVAAASLNATQLLPARLDAAAVLGLAERVAVEQV